MTVFDIQVGDLYHNPKGELCRVWAIQGLGEPYVHVDNHNTDDGMFEQYMVSELKPIPLTMDVLEKNGFMRIAKINENFAVYVYGNLTVRFSRGEIFLVKEGYSTFFGVKCEYVHKLQQLLRHCSIEKNIEL